MYKTLFESSEYWQDLMQTKIIIFLLLIAFTVLIIYLFIRELKYFPMTAKQKLIFTFAVISMFIWDKLYFFEIISLYHDKNSNPYALYKKGKCTYIEGVVHNYEIIGNMDFFYVKNVKFEINPYTAYPSEAFFSTRKANFSPLKDGVRVKICYLPNSTAVENAIVKLEYKIKRENNETNKS